MTNWRETFELPKPHPGDLTHSPIAIAGDENFTPGNGVVGGSGSAGDPYVIANWTIDAGGNGSCIAISNTRASFIIRNCTLLDPSDYLNTAGIWLGNVTAGLIMNNFCDQDHCGIMLESSANNSICSNTISTPYSYGIYLLASNNNTINSNFISNCFIEGMLLDLCSASIISSNIFFDCGGGIYLNGNDSVATGNHCSNGGEGLSVEGSNNSVTGNTCCDNKNWGLTIYGSNNTISQDNCSRNGAAGIFAEEGSFNTVTICTCASNTREGIDVFFDNHDNITYNTCTGNTGYGIRLYFDCSYCIVAWNVVQGNGNGCILDEGQNDDVHDNGCPPTLLDYLLWVLVPVGAVGVCIAIFFARAKRQIKNKNDLSNRE